MTDPIVPEPAPAYTPAPVAGPKQGLSLTSFILGIAGLVFSWVPVLGFLASLAAIILGFVAKSKEKAAPRWMWIVGIILGFVAIAISLIVIATLIIAFLAASTSVNYSN
ncbi:DUF4190 domain-containing protein [Galbitalea soli]|uniref:DUF4190 domain-containing protein n=1 Tax=Galbitalea soli TaxID=1268042 RepID=A0A7C9TR64_9MICO|nr:DUF4190 domain-containing protein [Galbitalea soli]NEM91260.1 DUF4190 domain-containing protein [Galbitalea soli]NYJ29949.1 hypothetical protein [Galbitalea soli]